MRNHGREHGHGNFGPGHPGRGGFERGGFESRRGAFGPFGPGFGGPGGPGPWGRGGRGGGPRGRARRGDVRASILALLKDRPMHGYEMIQEIAERSGDVEAEPRLGLPDAAAARGRGLDRQCERGR